MEVVALPNRKSNASEPAQRREARLKEGRTRRESLSRKQLSQVHSRSRQFDSIKLLLQHDRERITKLLPLKYARMAVSPFAFYRGSVAIMAADLAAEPNTGIMVQLCGDAHVQNMGSFEAPDGRLVFDINDFDETIQGPWEWDVKRMAASLVLAGYESNHGRSTCMRAVEAFASSYCRLVEELAEESILVAARYQIRRIGKATPISAVLNQAERADPADLLKKYTEQSSHGKCQFKKIANLLWRVVGKEKAGVIAALQPYRNRLAPERVHLFDFFKIEDVAFKVVGTGSVGLRDYVVLLFGNGDSDPLFLQIKQEVQSVYAPYLQKDKKPGEHEGRRVAEGQCRIQPLSDLMLGWTEWEGQHFLVRQLNDHKGSVDLGQLKEDGLGALATVAGELLARGHARSGDALKIKGYIGGPEKVIDALVTYGLDYAGQAQADFEQFQKAVRAGKIRVSSQS